jgi:DNA-binding HxlR family transcriptional regulator
MRYSDHICVRFQHAVEIIAKRWTALIIKVLMKSPMRFNELAEQLSVVSDRVLSERLKELEQEKIIERRVSTEPPIRVEYSLTEKGLALSPIIAAIEHWSHEWIALETPEGADHELPVAETEG